MGALVVCAAALASNVLLRRLFLLLFCAADRAAAGTHPSPFAAAVAVAVAVKLSAAQCLGGSGHRWNLVPLMLPHGVGLACPATFDRLAAARPWAMRWMGRGHGWLRQSRAGGPRSEL